jgi:hypothetical protein
MWPMAVGAALEKGLATAATTRRGSGVVTAADPRRDGGAEAIASAPDFLENRVDERRER